MDETAQLPVRRSRAPRDIHVLAPLAALTVLAIALIPFGTSPQEDAAMLMRYADNLAAGHGLVWNVGEAPVDGATDFLFTLAVAAVRTTGVDVVTAARLLILLAAVATSAVCYASARRCGASPVVAGVAALPLVLGPARFYAEAGFGAPFFGLSVATTAALVLELLRRPRSRAVSVALGTSALLMGLTRPEGVLLAVFLAAAVAVTLGWRPAVSALLPGVVVFVVAGGAYFAWRWAYFGFPLPNPYYKKGGAALHPDGLQSALGALAWFTLPFAALWIPALADRDLRRRAVAFALPILGFTAIWVLLSSEMNWMSRFQYPVLVLTAVFWPALFVGLAKPVVSWRPALAVAVAASVMAVGVVGLVATSHDATEGSPDQRGAIGQALAPFRDRGYVLATTEAGLAPLESGWRTLDTWGLNDSAIAHRGLTAADLDSADPAVVFVHQGPEPDGPWTQMTTTLDAWLGRSSLRLVRSVADEDGWTWNIWVSPDTPDSPALIARLASVFPGAPNLVPVQD